MHYLLGLYDYIKDIIHDCVCETKYDWKEGPLSHYIWQRKVVRDIKKERRHERLD